jgi:hypothetical protein
LRISGFRTKAAQLTQGISPSNCHIAMISGPVVRRFKGVKAV